MTFEAFKSDDGRYRWRLRDADGQILAVKPGKVMLPAGSAEKTRRSRAAVQRVLARIASADVAQATKA